MELENPIPLAHGHPKQLRVLFSVEGGRTEAEVLPRVVPGNRVVMNFCIGVVEAMAEAPAVIESSRTDLHYVEMSLWRVSQSVPIAIVSRKPAEEPVYRAKLDLYGAAIALAVHTVVAEAPTEGAEAPVCLHCGVQGRWEHVLAHLRQTLK